jgi:hypothetical protein
MMTMTTSCDHPNVDPARAEHDELARRLEARVSVDFLRRGLIQVFVGLIGTGFAVKLGWDRWGQLPPGIVRVTHPGQPIFLWIATAVAIVLLLLGIGSLLRARRLARDEDRLFARFRELRAALGLDR